ncbi:hypothetical protein B0H19DRAFT_1225277 [Mycena capillaripes]|nr:hypothetical protein B0H19DRAFT_1225277 [Mycena capillaripes]
MKQYHSHRAAFQPGVDEGLKQTQGRNQWTRRVTVPTDTKGAFKSVRVQRSQIRLEGASILVPKPGIRVDMEAGSSGFDLRMLFSSVLLFALQLRVRAGDPCAAIASKKWVSPHEARSCMFSFPVDEEIKANIIEVVNKSLAFHTSVNYQILAPHPFEKEVHEDISADIARIKETSYPSDFDFHLDVYKSFRRLNDGHCSIFNLCYDSLYISYLPTPLVLLTASDGSQNVHIAPEAFAVTSAEFPDQIEFWQNSLPGDLKGKLASLSGAKVLKINGKDPLIAVNDNAQITGGYQGFGTRQNSFFSSYSRGPRGWTYIMGNFAQQIHPLNDLVELTIQRINSSSIERVSIPYRSRFGSAAKNFTDGESYRANNCVNVTGTNGYNLYEFTSGFEHEQTVLPVAYLEQQPFISRQDRRQPINVMLDAASLSDVELPEELQPATVALNESYSVAQFYLLPDNITGVLALGSFSAANFSAFMGSLLDGLQELKSLGVTHLIVDVDTSVSRIGFIVFSSDQKTRKEYIPSRLIAQLSTFSTEPQAGLDTCTRAGPLAQLIVEKINQGADPEELLSYHPSQWRNSSNVPYSVESHWLRPTVNLTINSHADKFSPRLGQECQPFEMVPPEAGLFEPQNIVIISNDNHVQARGSFQPNSQDPFDNIYQGVKTLIMGGYKDVPQQYCGVVGGQSTHFAEIDTEIKSTYLKNHTLAPPDFKTNSVLGITWRLGFGLDNPKEPEGQYFPPVVLYAHLATEWQDHPADFNLPLTMSMQVPFLFRILPCLTVDISVNKPADIWKYAARMIFSTDTVVTAPAEMQVYMDSDV